MKTCEKLHKVRNKIHTIMFLFECFMSLIRGLKSKHENSCQLPYVIVYLWKKPKWLKTGQQWIHGTAVWHQFYLVHSLMYLCSNLLIKFSNAFQNCMTTYLEILLKHFDFHLIEFKICNEWVYQGVAGKPHLKVGLGHAQRKYKKTPRDTSQILKASVSRSKVKG